MLRRSENLNWKGRSVMVSKALLKDYWQSFGAFKRSFDHIKLCVYHQKAFVSENLRLEAWNFLNKFKSQTKLINFWFCELKS